MTARSPTAFARALAPLRETLWVLFLVWTLLVVLVWTLGLGPVELSERIAHPDLRRGLLALLGILDATWFTLAAVNAYLALSSAEGLAAVRRWAAIVLAGTAIIAALSAFTGFPLGPIRYTSLLGAQLGPVPFGLLPLWFAMITGARGLALWLAPKMSHGRVSALAGLLALLADVNLEPLAWKARVFWLWYPGTIFVPPWPPLQSFVTWGLFAAAGAFLLPETRVGRPAARAIFRPTLVYFVLNGVFLATHLARFIQR